MKIIIFLALIFSSLTGFSKDQSVYLKCENQITAAFLKKMKQDLGETECLSRYSVSFDRIQYFSQFVTVAQLITHTCDDGASEEVVFKNDTCQVLSFETIEIF